MLGDKTRIWMYHRVLPRRATAFGRPGCYHLRGTAISPEFWLEDLRRLQPVVPLDAVVDATQTGRAPPMGNVLTFDDGYAEWADLVAPSLEAAGATATFFITSSMRRDAPRPHAIDAYYWLLDNARVAEWSLVLPGGQEVDGDLRSDAGKRWLVIESPVKRALIEGDAAAQWDVIRRVARAVDVDVPRDLAQEIYMDEREWRTLACRNGIGAHGVTHRPWTLLGDSDLWTEMTQGRAALETSTGAGVQYAAYPDGRWDARVRAMARRVGYRETFLAGDAADASGGVPRLLRHDSSSRLPSR